LPEARRNYAEALTIYREMGDQMEWRSCYLVSVMFFSRKGGTQKRKLDIANRWRSAGIWETVAGSGGTFQFGKGAAPRRRHVEAQRSAREAIAKFQQVGDRIEVAHARLQIAVMDLDEAKNAPAARVASEAERTFEDAKAGRYAAEAKLISLGRFWGKGS